MAFNLKLKVKYFNFFGPSQFVKVMFSNIHHPILKIFELLQMAWSREKERERGCGKEREQDIRREREKEDGKKKE
jgi:hypothetical protein